MNRIFTLTLVFILSITFLKAQTAFTAGNIVVLRLGDGTAALANTGNAVFLDEYTPAGVKVQSIAIPTTLTGANNPLVLSGTAGSEGSLSRSADGKRLTFVGYSTTPPYVSSLSVTTGAVVPRVIGMVDYTGTVNTTKTLTNFASGNNPRGAYSSDGNNVWLVSGVRGIQFVKVNSPDTAVTICNKTSTGSALTNFRTISEQYGQLYASTGSGTSVRIGSIGAGLPEDTGKVITSLAGLPVANPSSPYGFFLAKVPETNAIPNVLYIADDNTNKVGGIKKYALNTVTNFWDSVGVIDGGLVFRGLTGKVSGSTVTLFATKSTDSLVTVTDNSAFNGAPSTSTVSLVAKAATGTVFRGVALAPFSVLPINDLSIKLSVNNNKPSINWTIDNELAGVSNTCILEKSYDGKKFEKMASFNYANAKSFSYVDEKNNNTTSFYRVVVNKNNGTKLYSNIIVYKNSVSNSVKIYPNPASDFVVVTMPNNASTKTINLLDLNGKILKQNIISPNQNTFFIPVNDLAKGVYLISYVSNEISYTEKFIKE